jgi:plasmid stabilization system protein ParE
MAMITKRQAVDRLTVAVQAADPDDLIEIFNELFPEEPTTRRASRTKASGLAKRIVAHIEGGLEVEEIVDLWNVVFPKHRRVWFDEDDEMIHYDENVEPVGQAD